MFLYQAVLYFCQLFGGAFRKMACVRVFLFVDGGMFEAPSAYFLYDGQQVDAFQGEVIDKFLFVGRIGGFGEDAFSFQHGQAICQDIGGYSLFGLEEFPEMPAPSEHDIPEDEEAPFIAKNFHRQVHGTMRSVICHSDFILKPVAFYNYFPKLQLVVFCN